MKTLHGLANHVSPPAEPAEQVIAATRKWLERAVIGLQLCPFAVAPHLNDRVRYCVSVQRSGVGLLEDLSVELQALQREIQFGSGRLIRRRAVQMLLGLRLRFLARR